VFQRTFKSIFVKSAATAEEKAVLQQQKEEQQKANLARLQQAKEERAQRESRSTHAQAQQA
jgi:guanylate kinase